MMWFAVFYNVSVRKASKALIMRDYDTTISPLSDGSYQRSVRIIVRLVGIENNNKPTGLTAIRQETPLWRICGKGNQEKVVSLRPWWRSVWPAFTSCVDFWKYVEPKAEVGTLCEEHSVSFFYFSSLFLCCLWILSTRGVASEQLKITKISTENTIFPI